MSDYILLELGEIVTLDGVRCKLTEKGFLRLEKDIKDNVCTKIKHVEYKNEGLSMRDQFAMAALSSSVPKQIIKDSLEKGISHKDIDKSVCKYSYRIADAMLKARGE